jgi:teichuronic acid biosynthesis glycosyltransferase TuaC
MGRLKIAVVTPELPNRSYPNRGHSVYQTLLQLSDYADLQAFCPLPRYPNFLQPRFDYRKCDLSFSLPGVPSRYFEYPALPVVTRAINGFVCARSLEPHTRDLQADVVLNFLLYPAGFAALSLGRRLGIPVVLGTIGSDLNAIPDRVTRWLTRRTLRRASRVIAKSGQLCNRAIAMGADLEKTHIVPNGCDSEIFFPRDRETARVELNLPVETELVVFTGRIHPRKGVSELLDAAAILSLRRRNFRLVYIGDGPELPRLKETARTRNLGRAVSFAGSCSPPEVARWLAAANLMALPSYAEGCPNSVIEALSCGRPVVATPVGNISELIGSDCGALAPVGDAAALASAIGRALDSTWDANRIAKRFCRSWKQVALEVLAICENSVQEARAQFDGKLCAA